MVFLRASLFLKWRTRMPRLCRYECSEVMISKMACRDSTKGQEEPAFGTRSQLKWKHDDNFCKPAWKEADDR